MIVVCANYTPSSRPNRFAAAGVGPCSRAPNSPWWELRSGGRGRTRSSRPSRSHRARLAGRHRTVPLPRTRIIGLWPWCRGRTPGFFSRSPATRADRGYPGLRGQAASRAPPVGPTPEMPPGRIPRPPIRANSRSARAAPDRGHRVRLAVTPHSPEHPHGAAGVRTRHIAQSKTPTG